MNIFRPFFVVFEIKTQKWSSLKLVSFYLYKRMFYSCFSFLFFFCVCVYCSPFSFFLLFAVVFPKSYYNKLQYKLTIMQKEDMETSMKMKLNHNCVIFFRNYLNDDDNNDGSFLSCYPWEQLNSTTDEQLLWFFLLL